MNTVAAIDPRFIVNRQGRDTVLYAGLLDLAHRTGLKGITTKLLQARLRRTAGRPLSGRK